MQTRTYSITINAPKETVWHTMLDDATYREWTAPFSPGSYYKGGWNKGSKIVFIGPNPETGKEGGMVSRIAENRPYEYISIQHLGIMNDGVEDTTSAEAKKWAPAFENYTFTAKDGTTEVRVDIELAPENIAMFDNMWPESLNKLKAMAENRQQPITVTATVNAPIEKVWACWTEPEHIVRWAFASDDWEAPSAENDLRTGGKFKTVMAAKDKSQSFDFSGVYTDVQEPRLIACKLDDGRTVKVIFTPSPAGVKITETFDPENENSEAQQRAGWQAMLDNFKKYTKSQLTPIKSLG